MRLAIAREYRNRMHTQTACVQLFVEQITALGKKMPGDAHMWIMLRIRHIAHAGEIRRQRLRRSSERRQQLFLLRGAIKLPHTQPHERDDAEHGQREREPARAMPAAHRHRSPALYWRTHRRKEITPMWTTVAIVAFLLVIVYNLGVGLYYMMTDKGQTDRMLKALTRRIGLSVLLILLVILGIWTGVIKPHGIGR